MDISPRHITETTREIGERIRPGLETIQERLGVAGDEAVKFIRERPGVALIGAIAVGFLFGRLVSRI